MNEHYLKALPRITVMIFDVDGILTDGSILLTPDGEALRSLNTKDGHALARAAEAGIKLFAITRGSSDIIKKGLMRLGFEDVALKTFDKYDKYKEYKHIYEFEDEEVVYMGDDLPDIELLREVAVPACPADAVHEVKEICRYISPFNGGRGCVRDVVEKVLRAQGKWYREE